MAISKIPTAVNDGGSAYTAKLDWENIVPMLNSVGKSSSGSTGGGAAAVSPSVPKAPSVTDVVEDTGERDYKLDNENINYSNAGYYTGTAYGGTGTGEYYGGSYTPTAPAKEPAYNINKPLVGGMTQRAFAPAQTPSAPAAETTKPEARDTVNTAPSVNDVNQSLLRQSAAEDSQKPASALLVPLQSGILNNPAFQYGIDQAIEQANNKTQGTPSAPQPGNEQSIMNWAWRNTGNALDALMNLGVRTAYAPDTVDIQAVNPVQPLQLPMNNRQAMIYGAQNAINTANNMNRLLGGGQFASDAQEYMTAPNRSANATQVQRQIINSLIEPSAPKTARISSTPNNPLSAANAPDLFNNGSYLGSSENKSGNTERNNGLVDWSQISDNLLSSGADNSQTDDTAIGNANTNIFADPYFDLSPVSKEELQYYIDSGYSPETAYQFVLQDKENERRGKVAANAYSPGIFSFDSLIGSPDYQNHENEGIAVSSNDNYDWGESTYGRPGDNAPIFEVASQYNKKTEEYRKIYSHLFDTALGQISANPQNPSAEEIQKATKMADNWALENGYRAPTWGEVTEQISSQNADKYEASRQTNKTSSQDNENSNDKKSALDGLIGWTGKNNTALGNELTPTKSKNGQLYYNAGITNPSEAVYHGGYNQATGDLQLQADIANGKITYDQIYDDYVKNHVSGLYQRYIANGMDDSAASQLARQNAMKLAYQRIYNLGYRPDYNDQASVDKYAIPGMMDIIEGMEKSIGNNYWTNGASYNDRLTNMVSGGFDGRDDRLFDELTSELAGNAYMNQHPEFRQGQLNRLQDIIDNPEKYPELYHDENNKPINFNRKIITDYLAQQKNGTKYSTTPGITNPGNINDPSSWNTALQAAMSGQLTKDQIIHMYDSNYSDLVIPEEAKRFFADPSHAIQQLYLNYGKNFGRTQSVEATSEEFQKALQALINANPALKLMVDNGVLSTDDVAFNFFKELKITDTDDLEEKYKSYGGGYSRSYGSGGGGGGGGGGYSTPNSAASKNQEETRIHNIMKNWTF